MSSIATNINASRAEHAMTDATQLVEKSTTQLATGRRINSASDDTAGMAIGSKLTAQSISLQRAMRNANEGVSMLQTADNAAGSMSQALVRMREIAVQAANDSNNESDRLALDNEFTQLREHLNTVIDSTEGVNAAAPATIVSSRDGLRQTVIDLMQLVRQVEVGMDVDGDGSADLNAQRIYYAGQSFGGIYGTMLLGVEPNIQAGVPNVPGGSITEVARLGAFRLKLPLASSAAPILVMMVLGMMLLWR